MTNTIALVVAALIQVESGGNVHAVGDSGRAIGNLQMWPVAVREATRVEAIYARREGRQARSWDIKDRRNPEKSRQMAEITLKFHYRRGTTNAVDLACKWNRPFGKQNAAYRKKVLRELASRRKDARSATPG